MKRKTNRPAARLACDVPKDGWTGLETLEDRVLLSALPVASEWGDYAAAVESTAAAVVLAAQPGDAGGDTTPVDGGLGSPAVGRGKLSLAAVLWSNAKQRRGTLSRHHRIAARRARARLIRLWQAQGDTAGDADADGLGARAPRRGRAARRGRVASPRQRLAAARRARAARLRRRRLKNRGGTNGNGGQATDAVAETAPALDALRPQADMHMDAGTSPDVVAAFVTPAVEFVLPPDLVVQDVEITSIDDSLGPGLSIPGVDLSPGGSLVELNFARLSATVANIGGSGAAGPWTVAFSFSGIHGAFTLDEVTCDTLAAGDTVAVQSRLVPLPEPGSYNFTAAADSGDDVPESSELNNSRTESFRTVQDFYTTNLSDFVTRARARNAARDGYVGREDMIDVLGSSEDDGVISAAEMADLGRFVGWGEDGYYGVADHVLYFADNIVNGARANGWFQGAAMGNLTAGSTDAHMNNLIQKWFFGADRPEIMGTHVGKGYAYRLVSGSLFVDGHEYTDVDQNRLGDCYLLAAVGALSCQRPLFHIPGIFIDNGDDTWTVRFYDGDDAHYVTVDRFLPACTIGQTVYAGWGGGHHTSAANELWVSLLEKAYAQYNEMDRIGQSGDNTYAGIDGGWPHNAIEHISIMDGHDMGSLSGDRAEMIDAMMDGDLVGVNTSTHAYVVVDYSPAMEMFKVYNPHGHLEWSGSWASYGVLESTFSNWWRASE